MYVIRRKDGKYFAGPAQFEHFSWSPNLEDALKGTKEDMERLRKVREMRDDTEVYSLGTED